MSIPYTYDPGTKLVLRVYKPHKQLPRDTTLKHFRTYQSKSRVGVDKRSAAKLQRKYAAGQLSQTEAIIGILEVALDGRVRK